MQLDHLFYIALLGQIIVLSHILPKRIYDRLRHVLDTYPASEYPNLYPGSAERYVKAVRTYRWMNIAAFVAGFALLAYLIGTTRSGKWDSTIVMWYYLLQVSPLAIAEIWAVRYYREMREQDTRTTRTATLQPRRLLDFVSPVLVGVAAVVYLMFCVFIVYVRQFGFPWFGGYLNIVIITAANVLFGIIITRKLRGKRLDPYQDHEDRMSQIGLVINQLFLVSIAATVFAAISIVLATLEMRHMQGTANCLYFVLLSLICYRKLRIGNLNFEVYRRDRRQQESPVLQTKEVSVTRRMPAIGLVVGLVVGAFIGVEFGRSIHMMILGAALGAIVGGIIGKGASGSQTGLAV